MFPIHHLVKGGCVCGLFGIGIGDGRFQVVGVVVVLGSMFLNHRVELLVWWPGRIWPWF